MLHHLNRELLALGMAEPPLVSMLFMQVNGTDGSVCFSRASAPSPVYIPAVGEVSYWQVPGTLLGVCEGEFLLEKKQLLSGDKIVLLSEGARHPFDVNGSTHDQVLSLADKIRHLPLQAFVEELARGLLEMNRSAVDFTLLGVAYG